MKKLLWHVVAWTTGLPYFAWLPFAILVFLPVFTIVAIAAIIESVCIKASMAAVAFTLALGNTVRQQVTDIRNVTRFLFSWRGEDRKQASMRANKELGRVDNQKN